MELRRYLGRLQGVLVVAQLALFVSAKDCLLAAEDGFTPLRNHPDSPCLPSRTQAIITSYHFGCCGNITLWQTYIQPAVRMSPGAYDINFQVWRPSPTVQESGCYTIVGDNIFTSISPCEDGLISETPEPSNILTVQPGDVLGYFMVSRRDTQDGILLDNNRSMESVWYQTNFEHPAEGQLGCPIPVGNQANRILTSFTSAAPVLSVDLYSFECLTTSTISPSSSSSLPASVISTATSVHTQLSFPSHTSSVLSVSHSPSVVSSPILTTSSAALSIPVVAIIATAVCSILLLTLLSTILLAIIITRVQHKRQRTWTLPKMPLQ